MRALDQINAVSAILINEGGFEEVRRSDNFRVKPIHRNNAGVLLQHPESKLFCSLSTSRLCLYKEVNNRVTVIVEAHVRCPRSIYDNLKIHQEAPHA